MYEPTMNSYGPSFRTQQNVDKETTLVRLALKNASPPSRTKISLEIGKNAFSVLSRKKYGKNSKRFWETK